jgi:hypothetical protein
LQSGPTALPSPKPTLSFPPTPEPTATKVAGVSISITTTAIEEGESLSVTIVLDAEPKAAVTISISSGAATSYLSFSESAATFTPSNFDTAVTFIASAPNDDIDRGDYYVDQIVFTISEEDGCDLTGDAVSCDQKVSYSDISLGSTDVTIHDDDTAGVSISTTSVSTTIDNYGDSLTTTSYAVVLTSEPVDDVHISASGLGDWTAPSSSDLVFTASNWDSSKTVSLTSTAASSNRPVCPNGGLYCTDLADRTETISHTADSSDSMYNGITIDDVDLSVTVVYDTQLAPTIDEVKFSDALNTLIVTLDSTSDKVSREATPPTVATPAATRAATRAAPSSITGIPRKTSRRRNLTATPPPLRPALAAPSTVIRFLPATRSPTRTLARAHTARGCLARSSLSRSARAPPFWSATSSRSLKRFSSPTARWFRFSLPARPWRSPCRTTLPTRSWS